MERIIVFFAKKTMLVNVIVLAVLFVGGYYYFNLNREAFPSTDMDMMLIAVTYPGASILDECSYTHRRTAAGYIGYR